MARTGRDRFNKVMGALHARLFRSSKGRIGASMRKAPMLLLNTTGAKSGQPRTSPLIYLARDGAYVVVASNAGQDHAPGWYHNLLADPAASVEIAGATTAVRAEVIPASQHSALWPELDALFSGYATYRKKTTREIPLVRLREVPA